MPAARRKRPLITAVILAWNEERNIEEAIRSAQPWADQIIVIDNESSDDTVRIARRYTRYILHAPRALNFDALRNLAIEHAKGLWIYFLDADERVSPALGAEIRRLIEEQGEHFSAAEIPFRHHFCGRWMRNDAWWPGYTRPQLCKKGFFEYNQRLHSGVLVRGSTIRLPALPERAVTHYSYDSVAHFIEKTIRYTAAEAENLLADGAGHGWEAQLAGFTHDWSLYYDHYQCGAKDGKHGFVLAFLYAAYRFLTRARLWDLRRQRGELADQEPVPGSVREMLELMLRVEREGGGKWQRRPHRPPANRGVPAAWLQAEPKLGSTPDGKNAGITAVVFARNEESWLEGALKSLQGWTDRIVVVDNESTDGTAEIARRYTEHVLSAPAGPNFEAVRLRVQDEVLRLAWEAGPWLVQVDADERFPARLGTAIRRLVIERGDQFEGLVLPFRHIFYGKWMESGVWWPGYTTARLVKRGCFEFGGPIHSGTFVKGRVLQFPADDPECAIFHYAYDDIGDYLEKLNRYTDSEAEIMDQEGLSHSWHACLAHFVHDWQVHYDGGGAARDGMHGFVQSFLCAFYRFASRAKLWDLRRRRGETDPEEPVPGSLREMLAFMLHVLESGGDRWIAARQGVDDVKLAPASAPLPLHPAPNPVALDPPAEVDLRSLFRRRLRVRFEGPFTMQSSLGHASREICLELLACKDIDLEIAEAATPWHRLTEKDEPRLAPLFRRLRRPRPAGWVPDVTIRQGFPPDWSRPERGKLIVISPWELSHLPSLDWLDGAKQADEIWAYSRFVRLVYVRSGLPAEKVRVVPLGVRTELFTPEGPLFDLDPFRRKDRVGVRPRTLFLSVGGTIRRKGADRALSEYLRTFTPEDGVCLVAKDTGSETFYADQNMSATYRAAAADLAAPEVVYLPQDLREGDLRALYRTADCVLSPYRGEGFGLAPLEGMSCGKPAIVTAGGSTDDYLDHRSALRVPYHRVVRRGEYTGPRAFPVDPWELDPDPGALRAALRWVFDHPEQARERGRAAREQALGWSWQRVAAMARERLFELFAETPKPVIQAAVPWDGGVARRSGRGRKGVGAAVPPGSPRVSLCMIARDEEPRIAHPINSVKPYVFEVIVVDTGSTDRSREAAHRCGAEVYDFPWCDDFSAARNASVALARGDCILWVDCDDLMDPAVGERMLSLLSTYAATGKGLPGLHVQVVIPPAPGRHAPEIARHVKIFPNRPDLRFEHRIHEQIVPALRQAGIPILPTDLYVTHAHYDRSPEGQAKKRVRDFRLLYLDLKDRPDSAFILFNLGMTYLKATHEYEIAAHYLRRSLERCDRRASIVPGAYALLVEARMRMGEIESALAAAQEGLGVCPGEPALLFLLGQLLRATGHAREAVGVLESLVAQRDDPAQPASDPSLRTFRGWHELALARGQAGDRESCERILAGLARDFPAYLPARLDLAAALLIRGERDGARALLKEVDASDPRDPALARLMEAAGME